MYLRHVPCTYLKEGAQINICRISRFGLSFSQFNGELRTWGELTFLSLFLLNIAQRSYRVYGIGGDYIALIRRCHVRVIDVSKLSEVTSRFLPMQNAELTAGYLRGGCLCSKLNKPCVLHQAGRGGSQKLLNGDVSGVPGSSDSGYNDSVAKLYAVSKEVGRKIRVFTRSLNVSTFITGEDWRAVIRVCFPDNVALEAQFRPTETFQDLIIFLKTVIAQPDREFQIYSTPSKNLIEDLYEDFLSAGFVPGGILYFFFDSPPKGVDDVCYLRDEVLALKELEPEVEPEPTTLGSVVAKPVKAKFS